MTVEDSRLHPIQKHGATSFRCHLCAEIHIRKMRMSQHPPTRRINHGGKFHCCQTLNLQTVLAYGGTLPGFHKLPSKSCKGVVQLKCAPSFADAYPAKGKEAVNADVSLKQLSKKLDDFAKERDWEKHQSPRNLLLAMVGEVGELSELFMWKGEVQKGLPGWEEREKEHLGEELSDVLLYLIRLSDMCGVDLGDAALKKIVKNTVKYPAPSKSA